MHLATDHVMAADRLDDRLAHVARRYTGEDVVVIASREAYAVSPEGRIEAVLVLTVCRDRGSCRERRMLTVVVPRHGGRAFGE